MYMCLDCYLCFESPYEWTEDYGEKTSGCPACAGAFCEAFYCDICGRLITDDYIKARNGMRICNSCITHHVLGGEGIF